MTLSFSKVNNYDFQFSRHLRAGFTIINIFLIFYYVWRQPEKIFKYQIKISILAL